jgi:hypothetical protein
MHCEQRLGGHAVRPKGRARPRRPINDRAMSLAFALLLAAWPVWTAQTATAEDLVAKNVAARGGAERIKAISTLRVTRAVGTPFATVRVTILRQRPGSLRIEQTVPGRPTTARITSPEGAWDETTQGWVGRSPAAAAESLATDADIDGFLVDYERKGHRLAYAGLEKVGGRPAHHLKVTLKTGTEWSVYLDPETFLERRHVGSLTLSNDTRLATVVDFSDWRDVAGVMFPFAIDEDRAAAGQTFAIYVEKIEPNVTIDPAAFAPPAAIRK